MIIATIQNSPYCTEITFPCTESELSKKLGELGINPEHLAPVGTVISIEPTELSMLEDCEVSLDALNYLGKRMEGMNNGECNQFLATLMCDELEIKWELRNIINLTFSLDRFTLIEDTSDLERVGLTHMFNIRGAIPSAELEDRGWLIEEGRKLLDSGKGIQTKYGLLFVNEESEITEAYNETTLPLYYYGLDTIISVIIKYGEAVELVELPNEDIAIKKALYRLGTDSLNECELEIDGDYRITDDVWNKITSLEKNKDLYAINALLKTEDILMNQTSENVPEQQSDSPQM